MDPFSTPNTFSPDSAPTVSLISTLLTSLPISPLPLLAILLALPVLYRVFISYLLSTLRPRYFPPGPPCIPLLGNLPHIPLEQPFLAFSALSKKYAPIFSRGNSKANSNEGGDSISDDNNTANANITGGILSLKLGPQTLILLSHPSHVRELFDKRGNHYSGRPLYRIPFHHVLKGGPGEEHILFLQNGEFLRRYMGVVRRGFGKAAIFGDKKRGNKGMGPILEREAAWLVRELGALADKKAESGSDDGGGKKETEKGHGQETLSPWRTLLRHWALSTPLTVISGIDPSTLPPSWIPQYFHLQHQWLNLLTPGQAPPVDIYPVLEWLPEWFPGGGWKKTAREVKEAQEEAYYKLLEGAVEQQANMERGENVGYECLLARLRREDGRTASVPAATPGAIAAAVGRRKKRSDSGVGIDTASDSKEDSEQRDGGEDFEGEEAGTDKREGFTDDQLAYIGGGLLDAAVDTVHATMGTVVLVLAAYPHVLKRAQEEVDAVCGDSKPVMEDLDQLKYLKACLMEILRWRPAAPNALPRTSTTPVTYNSHIFPSGSTFLIDVWGIHHNPHSYSDPGVFDPDRFLRNPWGIKPSLVNEAKRTMRREVYTFGSGRRICPGDVFATTAIMVAFATMVWGLDVSAPGGKEDEVVTQLQGFGSGLVLGPKDFGVEFARREGREV